jgi:hypothetical protein
MLEDVDGDGNGNDRGEVSTLDLGDNQLTASKIMLDQTGRILAVNPNLFELIRIENNNMVMAFAPIRTAPTAAPVSQPFSPQYPVILGLVPDAHKDAGYSLSPSGFIPANLSSTLRILSIRH